jgi:hypothetical protein
MFWTLKKKIHGVKAAPQGDKEGDSDEAKGCLCKHGYSTKRRYVRKSTSMTLNEALFRRQPTSLCFYSFLKENKE